jgi:dolichol-phosphate mannosyltransferase
MRGLIVTPTYQEAEGIAAFVDRFDANREGFELLVVDDSSPDGTGAIVTELAAERPWLHLLSRSGKDGLGSAYRAGFAWALEHDYELIGQMDADGQHPPEALWALRAALDDQRADVVIGSRDVVIGSRYVPGGEVGEWPVYRRGMSWVAGTATRRITGLRQRDLSGGYKLWRANALRAIDVSSTTAQGYGFQIETTMRAHRAGLRIVEEPIRFGLRMAGTSKLTSGVVWEGARLLVDLRRDPWSPGAPAA